MTDPLEYHLHVRELRARDRSQHMGAPQGTPRVSKELDEKISKELYELDGVEKVSSIVPQRGMNQVIGYVVTGNFDPNKVVNVICSNGCAVLTEGNFKPYIWRI